MRIKHIESIPLVRSLNENFQGGNYKITQRNTIVTRVELNNGIVGETFGGDEDEYQPQVVDLVNNTYQPLLLGGDVRDVEAHWERMWNTRVDLGNRGIHTLDLAKHCIRTQAIAAVDIALWDALGKSLNQPVYKLLGGYRDRVPVIAIGGYVKGDGATADLKTEIESYLSMGLSGMKMKVGKLTVEEDIERTRLARLTGGPDFHLCVDANQSWSLVEATKFARNVLEINLAWLEEPVEWFEQIDGNRQLRSLGIPINAGQGEISRHGCRDLITREAVDILNVDATIAAGVTEWRRIAAMSHTHGVRMAHHEEPQVALQLLAGVPNGLCVEIFPDYARDPLWFDIPREQPEIRDGFMLLTERPGFGIDLRSDVIERWADKLSPAFGDDVVPVLST
ncbi:MAG: mandelate racemase/muconate lactonizing enzyme family protein [Acidobacteriota bacterium]|nr:mandelate racemase/muconate lactonizing enzyme family protein [Acidobacteriota bacterium]